MSPSEKKKDADVWENVSPDQETQTLPCFHPLKGGRNLKADFVAKSGA